MAKTGVLVRIERDGNQFSINATNRRVRRLLSAELTYDYVKFLRGDRARQARFRAAGGRKGPQVEIVPTECFAFVHDPDGVFADRMIVPGGFLPRVVHTLKRHGYRVGLCDKSPPQDPNLFIPHWSRVNPPVEFRWGQREMIEEISNARWGGRINCPTGFGKSMAIRVLCQLWPKAVIDVATHSLDVLEQLHADISAAIPGVGLMVGGRWKVKGRGRINLYSGKSLHHAPGDANVLIVDEGHEWATDDYLQRIARYRRARRYMFSASQERNDGAHFELEGAFGPQIVDISYAEAVEHGVIVPIEVEMLDVIMDENPADGKDATSKERWGLWRNRVRNEIIAERIRQFPPGVQRLIMVSTIEHAAFLKKLLPEAVLCYAENGMTLEDRRRYISWGLLPEDEPIMTRDRRRELKQRFEQGDPTMSLVIANSVWKRGVDFKNLAVLLRADAGDSAISDTQIPGRVARLPGEISEGVTVDKEVGLVIDLLDQFDGGYKRKGQNRVRRYKSFGWAIRMPRPAKSGFAQKYLF